LTYKDAVLQSYTDVSASAEAKIKTMLKNYVEAHREIKAELDSLYASFAGLDKADWYNAAIKADRLQALLRSIDANISKYAELANTQTETLITDSMKDMYYRTQYIHAAFIPQAISLTTIPPMLVKAAVTGQAEAVRAITDNIIKKYGSLTNYVPKYGTLSKLLAERKSEAVASIEKAVTQSIIKGDGIRDLASNISGIFETVGWKAARIASAESMRVASAGQWAHTQDLISDGIEPEKMWMHVANVSKFSRPEHEHLDGKRIGVDDEFESNGFSALYPRAFGEPSEDIGCKCTYLNIVNGVTPATRTATNPVTGEKEVFSFKSYDEWRAQFNDAA
jgi:hypothetical protein